MTYNLRYFRHLSTWSYDRTLILQDKLLVYKQIRLLHEEFAQLFSTIYLPYYYFCLINGIIFSTHILIRYHAILPYEVAFTLIHFNMVMVIFGIKVLPVGSEISTQSTQYLKYLSDIINNKEIKKDLRACPVMKVKVGPYFRLEKWTNFQMFGFTFYWTARSFILFKPIRVY